MANYIKQSLEEGEKIIFNGRLHWSSIFGYILSTWILALGGLAALVAAYNETSDQQQIIYIIGAVLLVLALVVWLCGHIVRTRTEFAVTDTRFIQKDGILNIKMTEMPLARIETVNFYQTFFQRLLGTGCVEMVGSGGTSHQVHCIEEPMQVKKIICAAINKDRTDKAEQTVEQKAETNETNAK